MLKFLNQLSISNKLLSITLFFCAILIIIVSFTVKTLQQQETDSTVIDIAGRQRMLTQKYTMEVLKELEVRQSISAAQQLARAAANQIMADRAYYTEKVVAKLTQNSLGIAVSDIHNNTNAIPLPATFVREVSASLSDGAGYSYQLKSKWSINPEKGLSTEFEQRAWKALVADPGRPYFEPAPSSNGAVLHYAMADVGRTGCINCHNKHPSSPKKDFKIDGLMGLLTITAKITDDPEMARILLQTDLDPDANATAQLYEISQTALRSGGITFSDLEMKQPIPIPANTEPEIEAKLADAELIWHHMRSAVESIRKTEINTRPYFEDLNLITTLSSKILGKIHEAVGLFAQSSTSKVHFMVQVEWVVLSLALLLSGLYGLFIGRMITVPICRLTQSADRITKGEMVNLPVAEVKDELGVLTNAFQVMVNHLNLSQRDLKELTEDLEEKVEQRTLLLNQEISEREITESILRQSEARLQAIFDGIPDGIIFSSTAREILAVNSGMEKTFGYTAADLLGRKTSFLYETIGEYTSQKAIQAKLPINDRLKPYEARYQNKEGEIFLGETISTAIKDSEGVAIGFVDVVRDIKERKVLEEQVRRSQKMDAVGQLTGGIAHDFNNILGIIIGNLNLLEKQLSNKNGVLKRVETIEKAANRAANLTKQLLGFSRRQAAKVTLININHIVENMDSLIGRAITPQVSIETNLSDHLWLTEIDAGDLQDAILNLIINARDAMPNGGYLTLETENCLLDDAFCIGHHGAVPGEYVQLVVTDSGEGIPGRQLDQIFEPFFTTKPQGRGTGLGLAMVFGFVKRSKGYISVYSEIGVGTTFRIYLPRTAGESAPIEDFRHDSEVLPRGTEVILAVDDEEDLLILAQESLQALGYSVLIAHNGPEAMKLLDDVPDISLLFSDVVMPGGVSGYELAEHAKQNHPALKILLTSGYTEKALVHSQQTQISAHILSKPYTVKALAQLLRSVLDSPSTFH